MYNNNFKNNAIMRKIYKLLMSLVAMLAMAPVGLQAQSGNWTDEGNRAAEFSNVSGSTITITSAAEFALLAYNVNNGNNYQGTTFVLGTDLSMDTHYWTPIGTPRPSFQGQLRWKQPHHRRHQCQHHQRLRRPFRLCKGTRME